MTAWEGRFVPIRKVDPLPRSITAAVVMASVFVWVQSGVHLWPVGIALAMAMHLLYRHFRSRDKATTADHAAVSRHGVILRSAPPVDAARIANAYLVPIADGAIVRLVGNNGSTLLEGTVDSEADAERFLEALGHDASHKRIEFQGGLPAALPFQSRIGWAMLTLGLAAAALALLASPASALIALGAFVGIASLVCLGIASAPGVGVEVGVDGISLAWSSRRRFIPFGEIDAVRHERERVRLVLESGESVDVSFASSATAGDGPGTRAAFVARVEQAVAARERVVARADVAAALARGDRTREDWLREIQALDGAHGYRAASLREADLLELIGDGTAPADARAAAAYLLRKKGEGGNRIRIAADAVASPKLRIALERAADEQTTPEELDEALSAFCADDTTDA